MRGKMPKTELLVTFEVVAHHESYTRAAEELALTQSAIFRQIEALECFLNTSLFHHAKKRISLNAAGRHYLPFVKEILNNLERETKMIMAWQPSVQAIELAANPTFSTHWLIPNLKDFYKTNPDIMVNIHALTNSSDLIHKKYDIAIMRDNFCSPLTGVEYLFDDEILPVCNRNLLSHPEQTFSANEILRKFPLLHQSTRTNGWKEWFELSNISSPLVNKGPHFELLSMLIAAVKSSLGVALLPRFAIQHDLNCGDMVIPCNVPICSGNRFIMTWKKEDSESRYLQTLLNWLSQKKEMSHMV
ncbi:LysR substrate-binding domain-containing protein [Citrobacter portucalensis]|uniref:LysR substrate-binding domain-containing protein n=1 Tax=Citrobacter portucalensis TaxID=1639133 RepID=UPI001C63C7EF|nr:LysR substrate-binding domain-containing protein [Citrobacter portucalensis]MBW7619535.1 LysR family transcriptional regulator [Citrobacter portucalensis]MBW7638855.1 LysR family transcriptional regulator [Citrobacter portucalensis]MCA2132977.1 LysR family transcriptional regulator [Citrobacter portucalensis]MCA2143159.1 LysR family transcriptional regulator [Citrobacter portucalensis]MCA2148255.1 LysR family transcriptional regulator [Citrobacter portucalensis]